ncbi:MAG TPA: three-Cys-motif partner protein TcmP [Opitutaceae bacterium]
MNPGDDALYFHREQSQIKHVVLERYLEHFAIFVGQWTEGIIYVDGFSGPWNSISSDFRDSSFAIALGQLRSARDAVRKAFNKDLRIKCIFMERNPDALVYLEAYARKQKDVEVTSVNRDFEAAVPDLVRMVKAQQPGYFPLILIDPTGWKGFSMEVIAPLIQIRPCEVLINFMTSFIQRFIRDERAGLETSFRKLLGDDLYKRRIEGLEGLEREDAIVSAYADRIAAVGKFVCVPTTVVLHPTNDRTHFDLIYATRHLKSVEVFENAERKALQLSQTVRADAKRRARESASRQAELFGGADLPERAHLATLQEHYETLAARAVFELIQERGEVPYDDVYAAAMRFPIVQETYLRK